ncbi:MAG: class I SAM-dependent methyltransferase [Streptomycetales bacterium]
MLPPPFGVTVDLGCGEGRTGRELPGLGHRVVGIDHAPTLVHAAVTAAPPVPVVMADAAALPFGEASVGLVVSCMSLHDIDDFTGAIREVGRVLRRDGQLCIAIVHPFVTAQDDDTLHTKAFRVSRP